jgi:hypothetical protein
MKSLIFQTWQAAVVWISTPQRLQVSKVERTPEGGGAQSVCVAGWGWGGVFKSPGGPWKGIVEPHLSLPVRLWLET